MPITFDKESVNKELLKHPPAITFAIVSVTDQHGCAARLDEITISDTQHKYESKTQLLQVTAIGVKFARFLREVKRIK